MASNKTTPLSPIKRGPGRPAKKSTNAEETKSYSDVISAATKISARNQLQHTDSVKVPGKSKKSDCDSVLTKEFQNSLADLEARLSSQISDIVSRSLAPLKSLVATQQSVLNCKIESLEAKFIHLPEEIDSIVTEKINQALSHFQAPNSSTTPQTESVSKVPASTTIPNPTQDYERKYNVVVYGVAENPKGTPWASRASRDLNSVSSVISNIESSITTHSIRDCYRLGKYSESNKRPRPVLIKLHRSHDASIILSKRGSLKGSSITIKPDMSPAERATESILLKQRWLLIQSDNTNRIKIRGSSLFVNGRLHGRVINSQFLTHPLLSDYVTPLLNTSTSKDNAPISTDTITNDSINSATSETTSRSSTPTIINSQSLRVTSDGDSD